MDDFLEDFEFLDDWEDKYLFLIEKGRELEPLEETFKVPANIVEGCQSRVWVMALPDDCNNLQFKADSDSQIVKGLVWVVLQYYSGKPPKQIAESDITPVFERMELERHLSGNRSNGLKSMVEKIKSVASSYLQSQ
ncbi:MAG: SufE family protein [Candidatus Kapaibacteriales bacterium]